MTANPMRNLRVFPNVEDLYISVADSIVFISNKAIREKGRFTISLSGGQTPMKLYAILAAHPYREYMQWEKTFVFWGDERCVPLNDARNNAYQAKSILLDKVDIPPSNIYVIPVDLSPQEAADKYEKELRDFFGDAPPQFDMMLLGLGENGHTASLFPGTKVLKEKAKGIRKVYVKTERIFRVTMTAPLINLAHHIFFIVTGENKSKVLQKVLSTSSQPEKYPAQLIKPKNGELCWFADIAAARNAVLKNP